MLRALARAWLLVTGCLLLVTGSAQAAITDSTITTPTDPSFFIYDTTSPGTIAVTGSVTGTGDVDLRCYMGATSVLVTAGIGIVTIATWPLIEAAIGTSYQTLDDQTQGLWSPPDPGAGS